MPLIVFVAGDPSGDVHAAHLIEALKAKEPALTFSGLGGPAMQQAGMTLLDDLTQAAAIGPFDAAKHISRLRHARSLLEQHLQEHRPDLAILVDFGDFNLPFIAPLVKRFKIPIYYFISPQIWAWGRFRLRYVKRHIDRMLVFFRFEEAFYRREGVAVSWIGHPLVDQAKPSLSAEAALKQFRLNPWRRTVGLLPGSRENEIKRHLPVMLAAAKCIAWQMPGVQFVLPKAGGIPRSLIDSHLSQFGVDVIVAEGSVYNSLQLMEAAVVASGTATLDAALCGVPMAVIYKTTWPTYWAAKAVLRVPHIALVNVVAGRAVVPELVQHRATPKRIAKVIVGLLRDNERRSRMKGELCNVAEKLGGPGAANRAAEAVLAGLRQKS